jgi:hypothetical protein
VSCQDPGVATLVGMNNETLHGCHVTIREMFFMKNKELQEVIAFVLEICSERNPDLGNLLTSRIGGNYDRE